MSRLAAIVGVIAAIAAPAEAGWQEDAIAKTTAEVTEIEQVASLLKSRSVQCSDDRLSTAISHLDAQADRLAEATDMAFSRRSGAGTRYMGEKVMQAISPMIVEVRFTLADALLEASCLDAADKIYRGTISTFTGSRFEAARQRALIGIDDVRAKRAP